MKCWSPPEMNKKLDAIRNGLVDPMQQIAPIFMPTIRPGPSREIRGNFFLEEDPWSRDVRTDDLEEEQSEMVEEGVTEEKKKQWFGFEHFPCRGGTALKNCSVYCEWPKGSNGKEHFLRRSASERTRNWCSKVYYPKPSRVLRLLLVLDDR